MARQRARKPSKSQSKSPSWGIIVALLLLVVGGVYLWLSSSKSEQRSSEQAAAKPALAHVKTVKVFVENSGSMDGYVRAVNSQLKSDLNALVSGMSILKDPVSSAPLVDTIELNYINSELIPIKSSISHFTETLSVQAFRDYGGSRASTSLQDLLERVQRITGPEEVSIFISDMILDLQSGQSAESVSTNIETTLRRHLMNRPHWAVVVWRMESDFDGTYYEAGAKVALKAKRPYYILMMGDQAQLYSLLSKGQLPDNLPFYKHRTHQMILEQTMDDLQYTVSPSAISGSLALDRNDKHTIHEAKVGKQPSGGRAFAFEVKMYPSQTLQDEARLLAPASYEILPATYRLSKVRRGNDGAIYLRIESPEVVLGTITVSLMQTIPQWVNSVHAEANTAILDPKNLSRTYGIKYILEGLSRPYESSSAKLFTLQVNLKE